MTILLFVAALTADATPPLRTADAVQAAQPPAVTLPAMAAARDLVKLMQVERTLAQMFEQLVPLMTTAVVGALDSNPATAAAMKAMAARTTDGRQRVVAIFAEELSGEMKRTLPDLVEQTAHEYASVFSESELREVLAFYRSGTGAKLLREMPGLQQKMSKFGEEVGRKAGERAGERAMMRAMRELLPDQPGNRS